MELLEKILSYLPIASSVVGTFAMIAAVTPNKIDNKIVDVLLKVINLLGANVGNAENKDA